MEQVDHVGLLEFSEGVCLTMEDAFLEGVGLDLPLGGLTIDDGHGGARGSKRAAAESFGNERFPRLEEDIKGASPGNSPSSSPPRAKRKGSLSKERTRKRFGMGGLLKRRTSKSSMNLPARDGMRIRERRSSVCRSASISTPTVELGARSHHRRPSGSVSATTSPRTHRRRTSVADVDWRALPAGLVQMERRVSLGCASDQSSSRASSVSEESFSDCMSDYDSDAYFSEFDAREDERPAYLRPPAARYVAVTQPHLLRPQAREWTAYHHWLREVVKGPNEEALIRTPSLRMSIFLHFYRLEIPISEVKPHFITDEPTWTQRGRGLHKVASFLRVPLDQDNDPLWWLRAELPPQVDLDGNGCSLLIHMRQTFSEEVVKGKRVQRRKEKKKLADALVANENVTIFATEDPKYFKKRDMLLSWSIGWAVNRRTASNLRIAACRTLSSLVYPYEVVPGLTDRLWKEGVVMRILRYSRRGNLVVHEHVSFDDVKLGPLVDKGSIHRAAWNGVVVAAKVCSENNVGFQPSEFRFEVAIMCIFNHPNILPCLGAHCFGPRYMLLSPFKMNGSLQKVLLDKSLKIGWGRRLMLAMDVASALEYMHSYKVVHRDLKSANVVVGAEYRAFVTDFGNARVIGKHDKRDREKLIGTTEWMAPEMFTEVDKQYTEKIDVYSFGIILYEILTRTYPYSSLGVKNWQIPDLVIAGERPPLPAGFNCPLPQLIELMEACWHTNMKKRPSFQRIVEALDRMLGTTDLDDSVTQIEWLDPEKRTVQTTTGMMEALTDLDTTISLHDALNIQRVPDRLSSQDSNNSKGYGRAGRSDSSSTSSSSSHGRYGPSRHNSEPSVPPRPPETISRSSSFEIERLRLPAGEIGSPVLLSPERLARTAGADAWAQTNDANQSLFAASLASELTSLKAALSTSEQQRPPGRPRKPTNESLGETPLELSSQARLAAAATAHMAEKVSSGEEERQEKERELMEKKTSKLRLLFSKKSNKTMSMEDLGPVFEYHSEPKTASVVAPPGTTTPRTDLFSSTQDDIF